MKFQVEPMIATFSTVDETRISSANFALVNMRTGRLLAVKAQNVTVAETTAVSRKRLSVVVGDFN
jgi:hypothetical protein